MGWSRGPMEPSMRADIRMERNTEKGNSHLQMAATMKENLLVMRYVAEVNTTGQMESSMTGSGLKIRCMVLDA